MEWRKLKNIIILILLLLNGFLLVLVVTRRGEALEYDRAALEQTLEVLAGRGIQAEADSLSPGGLRPVGIERELEAELSMAQALLGKQAQADNRGGGLYLYQSELGQLSVRTGGELSAELSGSGDWHTSHPEGHAAGLLRSMGIEARQTGAQADGEQRVVRFQQLWQGAPVFSCEVEFVYEGGYLTTIRGTLLPAGQGVEEAGKTLTLPTALMRFLDGITAAGDVCSSIQSMEAGYRTTPLSGGVRMTAVWLVSSNTADYYLDGVTGALTRLTGQ